MKLPLDSEYLPTGAVFLTCATEEDRCRGVLERIRDWRPKQTVICTYSGHNSRRDEHLAWMGDRLSSHSLDFEINECSEREPTYYLRRQIETLSPLVVEQRLPLVIDISVFTKRHLLMLWRWLEDIAAWDRVSIVYSEPEDYIVSKSIPLTFGLESLQQIPGYPGVADCSRPVHLVLLLGYEGDQALAVYEQIQPMHTTLFIPSPPYRPEWEGRTETLNRDLLSLTGDESCRRAEAIEPEETTVLLRSLLDTPPHRGPNAVIICPLGTKPQTLGVFEFLRESHDPPAIIYASPLRHNKSFFSHGIGRSWILKMSR